MEASSIIKRKPLPHTAYQAVQDESLVKDEAAKERFESSDGQQESRRNLLGIIAIVLGCTLGILIAMLYLTFLWFIGPTKSAWTVIILSNWTATSVAICGVAIRWMSSFQMILCTAILAWDMLKGGSRISKIPRLSTLRYNNAGPLDFLYLLPLPPKGIRHLHLFVVIVLSVMVTIMLQLSSTLLLSDLATGPIESFTNSTKSRVLTNENSSILSGHYYTDTLMTTAPSYPLFAEQSPNSRPYHGDTVDDTGPVIRALLPVSVDHGRSKLLAFEGNATLYDARILCTQPKFQNLSLVGRPNDLWLAGDANHSIFIPSMASNNRSGGFNCSIASTQQSISAWTLFTCGLYFQSYDIGVINSLDSVYDGSKVHGSVNSVSPAYGPTQNDTYYGAVTGDSWLVINVTNLSLSSKPFKWDSWKIAFNHTESWTTTPRGPWARITSTQEDGLILDQYAPDGNSDVVWPQDNWSFALDVSVCSSAFPYTKSFHIKAKREKAVEEPVSLPAGSSQIGATRTFQDLDERGIMFLNETELAIQLSTERETILQNQLHETIMPKSYLFNFGIGSATLPDNDRYWFPSENASVSPSGFRGVSEDRVALFQHVIQDTNSPALAMQSMLHTVITDRYYKYLPYCTNTSSQNLTYSVDAIQPVRTRGFVIVMSSIGAHFFLVTYTLIVFGVFEGTKRTIRSVDQAWQVFAQVALLQREMTLDYREDQDQLCSTTATDHEIEDDLRRRGLRDRVFALDDKGQDGIVRFTER